MKWTETRVKTREGWQRAIAPEIISASRSTDVPAFYSEWFMNRLREGYVRWVNPFNARPLYVSLEKAQVIVFWSKNPRPMIPFLREIEARGLSYYFQYTLNDYEREKLEPGVPPLTERVETFVSLSKQLGRERVVWRFDPLILLKDLGVEGLVEKIKRLGDEIAQYTTKLVFSFADISLYRKVQSNLERAGIEYSEFDKEAMIRVATGIARLCREWGISAATCAEPIDLSHLGIGHNSCIDGDLVLRITNGNPAVRQLLGLDIAGQESVHPSSRQTKKAAKDPGQRRDCGCVRSKDIGQYNTCPHLCIYCYANSSEKEVMRNAGIASANGESIIG